MRLNFCRSVPPEFLRSFLLFLVAQAKMQNCTFLTHFTPIMVPSPYMIFVIFRNKPINWIFLHTKSAKIMTNNTYVQKFSPTCVNFHENVRMLPKNAQFSQKCSIWLYTFNVQCNFWWCWWQITGMAQPSLLFIPQNWNGRVVSSCQVLMKCTASDEKITRLLAVSCWYALNWKRCRYMHKTVLVWTKLKIVLVCTKCCWYAQNCWYA